MADGLPTCVGKVSALAESLPTSYERLSAPAETFLITLDWFQMADKLCKRAFYLFPGNFNLFFRHIYVPSGRSLLLIWVLKYADKNKKKNSKNKYLYGKITSSLFFYFLCFNLFYLFMESLLSDKNSRFFTSFRMTDYYILFVRGGCRLAAMPPTYSHPQT